MKMIDHDRTSERYPCYGCIYLETTTGSTWNGDMYCSYILRTGHMRGCPSPEKCTVKDTYKDLD